MVRVQRQSIQKIDNVIYFSDWLSSSNAFSSLDKKVDLMLEQLEELRDIRDKHLSGLEFLLNSCIENNITSPSATLQEALKIAAQALRIKNERVKRVYTISDIANLIQKVDDLIAEKEKSITKKRLDILKSKWCMIQND